MYKIRPVERTATNPEGQRSLRLRVDFRCVDDECLDAIEKQFVAALEASPYGQYAALLTSHLVSSVRAQLSTANLEVIGLIREVEMLPYRSVRWDDFLGALGERTEEVRQWLMAWHEVSLTLCIYYTSTISLSLY